MWLIHVIWVFSLIATSFTCSDSEYFSPENDYHYKYLVNVESSAVGTTNRKTGSEITCDVHILNTATGHCQYLLQVDKCVLSDLGEPSVDGVSKLVKNAKSKQFSLQLSRYSMYFTLSNGSVTAIAFHEDETLVAANFKRGIISSALTRTQKPNTQTLETRDDVQGSCSVLYAGTSSDEKRTKVIMEKDMNTCDFPSKSDWHFSPYSLFRSMSTVQTLMINSSASCTFEFSSSAEGSQVRLESSVCKERHARKLESTRDTEISVQTNIKQKLTFSEVSPSKKSSEKIPEKYRSASIHFKYENTTVPAKNSPDVDSKIRGLVNEIGMDLGKEQQDSEITTKFGELIDLLRVTPDLDKLAQRIMECASSKECMVPDRIHKTQILIYALAQCHHAHCLKVIRQVAGLPKDSLDVLMDDNFLIGFFLALTDAEIKDVIFIEELRNTCYYVYKGKRRNAWKQCFLALTSIVHSLWTDKYDDWTPRNKIPLEIKDVLDIVLNLPRAEAGEGRVLQFQAIGNLGDLLEHYKPDILDWLFKLQVSTLDHVSKIKATRRFAPSDALYVKLVTILKLDSFPQEDRVAAYNILVKKFHNWKLAEDVENLFSSNTTEHNLKTFIVSDLFALTKSTDYSTSKFARELLHNILSTPGSHFSIDQHVNSEFNEDTFWKSTSFLPQPINNLGLTVQSTKLYDGQDPASFYMRDNIIVHLLGQDFNIADVSIYLQGIDKLREQVQNFRGKDWITISLEKFLKRFGIVGDLAAQLPTFVDPTIVQRLQEIHQAFISKLKPSKPLNFLVSVGKNGGATSYYTYKDLVKYFEDHYFGFIKANHSANKNLPKTKYGKMIEAVNLVPTMAGLPLNWTADAYYLSKSELLNQDENPLKFDFRVGISASFRNRMLVDVPGFTDCGVQSITTASLAFNGLLEGTRDESLIDFGLLQQPAHIGFARKNYLIRGHSLESIADWDIKRTNQDWCSDILVPSVGLKLCHSRSYAQVTDRPDKPWALMAGDSHWNFTLRNVNDQRVVYSLRRKTENNATERYYKLVLQKTKSKKPADSPEEIEIFKFFKNEDNDELEIQLGVQNSTSPHISLRKLPNEPLEPNLRAVSFGTIYISPKINYDFNFTHFRSDEEVPRNTVPASSFHDDNITDLLHIEEIRIRSDITTATGQVYSIDYKSIRSPMFESIKYDFNYSCGSVPCNTWAKDIFPSEVWDTTRSLARVTIREDTLNYKQTTFDQFRRAISYQVTTPNNLYLVEQFNTYHTGVSKMIEIEITKYPEGMSESRIGHTFLHLKFGSGRNSGYGFNMTQYLASLSVPGFEYSARFRYEQQEGQLQSYLGIVRNPSMALVPTFKPFPKNETKGIEFNLIQKDRTESENHLWSDYKTNWNITFMFNRLEQITYRGQRSSSNNSDWNHEFELHIPQLNLDINAETTSVRSTKSLLHHSNFTTSGHSLGSFDLNITEAITESGYIYYMHKDIVVDRFVSTSLDLVTGLDPCDDKKNGYGNMDFTVKSTNNPILDSVFKANACKGSTFFEADFHNSLISGRMIGNIENGITSLNSNFTKAPGIELGKYDVETKFHFTKEYPFKPAVLQVKFPETNTTYYQLFQYYPISHQLIATACSEEICTDIQSNPKTLIAQFLYDFSDHDHVYRSMIINNDNEFSNVFRMGTGLSYFLGAHWNTKRRPSDYDYDLLEEQIQAIILPQHPILDSVLILLSPITNYIQQLKSTNWKSTPVGQALSCTHIPWLWSYFDGKTVAKKFVYRLLEENWQYHEMEIEDGHATHYFTEDTKLFATSDTVLSVISSKTYREFVNFFGISNEHYNYLEMFHISGYDRHAVLFENRNVFTFDQRIIKDVQSNYQQCPFLLTSDVGPNHFTVYVHNEFLHLLFPEVHVRIASNGSVYLNDIDIPINLYYRSESYDVRISLNEDIVEVKTEYSLAVKCVIGYDICIFYTNHNTYGNLVGLLGNNNDNPNDDKQPLEQWNLSSDKGCLTKESKDTTIQDEYGYRTQLARCVLVFGDGFHKKSLIYQGEDIVNTMPFKYEQCLSESSYPCSTGLAFVAMVAASKVNIQGPLDPCMKCNDHLVDEIWRENVEPLLEVVFVLNDDTERMKAVDIVKNLQKLSTVISKEFAANGFESIKFGLLHVGVHRQHTLIGSHREHKINGSQFFTSEEFVKETHFDYGNSINESREYKTILDALEKASDFRFDPKAVHVVVLITSSDEEGQYGPEEIQDTLMEFEEKGIILYTISNFPKVLKQSEIFGIRSDGHTIPQPQYKESVVEFPKGIYARVTSTTRGAVWLLSHMETNSATSISYDQTIAKELLARAKQDTSQCRRCRCAAPKYLEPETRCHNVEC